MYFRPHQSYWRLTWNGFASVFLVLWGEFACTTSTASDVELTESDTAIFSTRADDSNDTGNDTSEGDSKVECSLWQQDCPVGQKCIIRYFEDHGVLGEGSHCAPVIGHKKHGEDCYRDLETLNDDCDVGWICTGDRPNCGAQSTCKRFCDNSIDAPLERFQNCQMLGVPGSYCRRREGHRSAYCQPICDPLQLNCWYDMKCDVDIQSSITPAFFCQSTQWPKVDDKPFGNDGASCTLPPSVDSLVDSSGGLSNPETCSYRSTCVHANRLAPGDCLSSACCTPFCDLNGSEDFCPHEDEVCISLFDEPLPGYENFGVCGRPGSIYKIEDGANP